MDETAKQCMAGNLRYLRKYHGYTQWQLAELIHVTRSSYSTIELGIKVPRIDLLFKLSKIYHIRVDTFFERDTQQFIKEVSLANGKDKAILELAELYRILSPFSQGCLFEKALQLLDEQNTEYRTY